MKTESTLSPQPLAEWFAQGKKRGLFGGRPVPRTTKEIDREFLRAMRNAIDTWLVPEAPYNVRLMTAVRLAELDMRHAQLEGFPLPDGEFGWRIDEAEAKALAVELQAPVLAVRAGLAWLKRAEAAGDDMSFYDEPIFGAAGYRASGDDLRHVASS